MDLGCPVILIQEHKLDTQAKLRAARAEADRRGWYLCAQAAETTEAGGSQAEWGSECERESTLDP